MQILIINTQNKLIVRDIFIKAAIKAGMQYVEMENEILIDGCCLIKIKEKEIVKTNFDLFILEKEDRDFRGFVDINSELKLEKEKIFSKQKKHDYKKQSKLVNDKLKHYNNRRR